MKFVSAFKERVSRSENHPLMGKAMERVDRFAHVLTNRNYDGKNPAVASVYAPLRMGMIAVVAITLITVIFGMIVPMESAAIAQGTVVVMSKRKTVQHLEGGIVKAILVKEGDKVEKDQPLMEISDVAPKANQDIVQQELWVERAAETRAMALHEGVATIQFPEAMQKAAETNTDLAQAMQTQEALFNTQRQAQLGKLKTLKQRATQLREEITGLEAQVKSAEGQLALTDEEITSVQQLLKEGLATKPRLLALQRQSEELRGQRGQALASIAKARQAITESELQVINQENDFATNIAGELRDIRTKIADYEEKLRVATDVMQRTVVLAPTEGIVTGLKFHTVGGVVAPGTPILDIVPQGESLVLEVRVLPTDIDVVKPGLESKVIFPAYKARRMPLFIGKVTQVSADAFSEQQGMHNVSYYTARVEVEGYETEASKAGVTLYPGMPADVYIRTGSRSFLGYLLAPVTDSMDQAFKEE